jgi:hypothetical protein
VERPVVHCLVARVHAYGFVTDEDYVTLDKAASYAEEGYTVIPDYGDMEALTRWEQMQRAMAPRDGYGL